MGSSTHGVKILNFHKKTAFLAKNAAPIWNGGVEMPQNGTGKANGGAEKRRTGTGLAIGGTPIWENDAVFRRAGMPFRQRQGEAQHRGAVRWRTGSAHFPVNARDLRTEASMLF